MNQPTPNNSTDQRPDSFEGPTHESEKTSSDLPTAERKLHPMSWLFIVIAMVKSFFVPVLIALVAGGSDSYELIGGIVVVPAILFAIVQYVVYRYHLQPNEIVIREGVLFKNIRHVKYDRIQNVNLSRNPLHRLLGVAELELESASGGKPEATMRVVAMSAVEEMNEYIRAAKQKETSLSSAASKKEEPQTNHDESLGHSILQLDILELVKAGIISNKGMVVVAFAFGILGQTRTLEKFFNKVEDWLNPWMEQISWGLDHPVMVTLMIFFGAIAFFVAIRVLSIIFMIVTYFGFDLQRQTGQLKLKFGLLTQRHATIPLQRIQMLSIVEGVLHRWFNRVAIRIATAGGNVNHQQQQENSARWLAPILATEDTESFIADVQPHISQTTDQWHGVAQRGWLRLLRLYSGILIILIGLSWFKFQYWSLLGFALLPFIILYSRKTVAAMRYGFTKDTLVYKSGWLTRYHSFIPLNKIQNIQRIETFFDRRNRMAKIQVDVAGLDLSRHTVSIRFLDQQQADELLAELYQRVCNTQFVWR
ncbi:PH domain-containing protein [Pleionea litopenaei]|uniref:PH domain-containing protein n=1 Tax=Pleionea litopenaei TaxID=3070815 RepID=A0AA51RX89_9GAMM|nr:PH domain-containing protein [Pleionea sp. HL-JVS1]WMS89194.1 PH domain-containing protein [Pleionea sp. HL-JVS1]